MVPIGNKPIIEHIMGIYAKYGHKEFYVALGYKGDVIKKYFENFKQDWEINLIETGSDTFTGGRLKRLEKYLKNETFLLTYEDGLADININESINFHKKHKKMVTISAVRPPARFGSLSLNGSEVIKFKEKTQLGESWINGGFFVINPKFFNLLKNDKTVLESEPLETATNLKNYEHTSMSFVCMDHKLDKDALDLMIAQGDAHG